MRAVAGHLAVLGLLALAPAAHGADVVESDLLVPSGDVMLSAHTVGGKRAGQTLVIVTGGPGLSRDYVEPLERLAGERLRVVTFDARGTGLSSRPDDATGYSLGAYIGDLEALRGALGVERFHLLGHSWGTVPAMAYAIAHPDRVASLILLGGGAPTASDDRKATERLIAKKGRLRAQGLLGKETPARPGDCIGHFNAILPAFFANPRHPGARSLPGSLACEANHASNEAVGDWDFTRALSRLTMPVLVMSGDADINDADEIAGELPGVRLDKVVLRACGHFPWLECPEPFFAEMVRFLTGGPTSSNLRV